MANNEYLNKNFLDSYGTKWLFDILTPNSGSLIYTAITDESVDIQNKIKTTPAWNNGEVILSSVHTASQIEPNYKDYSLNVYSYDSCSVETKQFTNDGPNIKLLEENELFCQNPILPRTHYYMCKNILFIE